MNLRDPTESFSQTEIDCTYLPVEDGGLTILMRFRTGEDHASFAYDRGEADATGQPTTEVNDVGDEAYYSSTEFGIVITHTLVARRGSVVVIVGAPVTLDQEKDLIRKIFANLL